ncbi:carbon-monoxide dehydrogenase medium subunit [Enhydrobacter aerosaccus]|uniref:Carbon-monoxide dehydrogenase medium subunit n=1 Tax=Enhydrobacter aerosaccus TaxID=225324 RepID=A0A1T4R7M6_9HYPH|nr:xanthine dehydrogenase family protein subunit M [Enhydrobacter aerosaccus]SKA11915.1 carbon-monoxide dehydrogenase medium subunit [Enhydrobacter aerosaccus]
MRSFAYDRPATIDRAVALLAGEGALALAGGMTLLPTMKLRLSAPEALVDLSSIADLKGIASDGKTLTIGAMTRHADVARSAEVAKAIPGLARLAGRIGDPQVRNRGTLGGSLANNDPAADYPAAVLALGATLVTSRREIAADEFFRGMFETALEPGELLTAVRFPVPYAAAYAKFPHPASRFALVGVFVAQFKAGVRVAVTGAASSVFRCHPLEARLSENFAPEAVAGFTVDPKGLNSDIHAEPAFRAHLIGVMARRAVAAALQPAV